MVREKDGVTTMNAGGREESASERASVREINREREREGGRGKGERRRDFEPAHHHKSFILYTCI